MNAALIRKEFRELLPWGVLSVFVALIDIIDFVTTQTDLLPLGSTFPALTGQSAIVYWLLSFAIGTGLATREHDDGTLNFLDGLPVSRTRVFMIKFAVMTGLVALAPVLRIAVMSVVHLMSRTSLDYALHPGLLLQGFSVHLLLIVSGLAIGAAMGRLRSLTWLGAAILGAGVLLASQTIPQAATLNPLALLDWQWANAGPLIDPQIVLLHLGIAGVAFVIAWQGFVHAGKSRIARIAARPVVGAVVTVTTVLAAVCLVVIVFSSNESQPDFADSFGPGQYAFALSPPARTETEHYSFSYPSHRADAAIELAAEADAIFERVHEMLGVPLGPPISVDASGSAAHTDGTAFFDRLRMTLDSEVAPVLAHETAHVVSRRVAGNEDAWLWGAAGVLNEGLASWVETPYRESPARVEERLFVLAAMHARRQLIVDELASPGLMSVRRDEYLQYYAGEELIRAMIRVYGEESIPRLLAAFADPSLPQDLGGMPLWTSAFQLAGMNVAAVIDEFYRHVGNYADANAERIAALPRPRVRLVRFRDTYGVIPLVDEGAPADTRLTVRFRPAPDSPMSLMSTVNVFPGRPIWRAPADVVSGRVCVQVGVRIGNESLFEPWSCIPTSAAAEFDP